uniref:[histone H3]-lysine(4) N-trimethyltransferase n=1 Tax=Danio rerio TaxID=7955 RepID=Q32LV8_DANRE|nr:SET and MYND domain containing 3 [Danio rerio]|eukprot:NP_001032477.1 histone-lysine N-methyltransferase SMYD3 [Danio rerio]
MEAVIMERFISEGKGNGLRALREIKPGEVIYSCEPFAFCVARDFLKTACQSCLKRGESLSRCSQCKTARYCNVQCQKQAWPDHKRECKCLKHLQPRIPTDSVRLVARIIFKLLSQSESDQEELYSIAEHQSHLADMSEEKTEGLKHLCTTLQVYLAEENCDLSRLPSGLDPVSLLARVTCNCFSISDGELQDVGVGLYPSMSLLNHDCQPNCIMMFEGKRLTLRAVRVIRSAEELTISYTDILAPSKDRRSQHWDELLKESQALLHRHSDVVPDRNIYMLRLLDLAMDACISLDDYETALEYGNRALGPYKLYFSDPHPSRAVELLRVGKLQHFLGRLEEARGSFTQAYSIMSVTHGAAHALTNQVQRRLSECQAELNTL